MIRQIECSHGTFRYIDIAEVARKASCDTRTLPYVKRMLLENLCRHREWADLVGFGIRKRPTTPLISLPDLKKPGVKRISLPRMVPAAAIHGMTQALAAMKGVVESGVPIDRPDLAVGIEDIMKLMDYDGMRALETRLTTFDEA